jgi:thiamine biosynthesis lipoprotein
VRSGKGNKLDEVHGLSVLSSLMSNQHEFLNTNIKFQNSHGHLGNYKSSLWNEGININAIINPITGLKAKAPLMPIADDCMTADAYATSFMVMGLDGSKQFLADHKDLGLEFFFIYDDKGTMKTYISDKFSKH